LFQIILVLTKMLKKRKKFKVFYKIWKTFDLTKLIFKFFFIKSLIKII
jgi:hypothetical protein